MFFCCPDQSVAFILQLTYWPDPPSPRTRICCPSDKKTSLQNFNKSCYQLNRSIYLILFKKRVKISSNFRVLPLEARSQTALATCGKQDLQPVNQTISQEITLNFSQALTFNCSVCFYLYWVCVCVVLLLVCVIYGATSRQALYFQQSSVCN